MKRFKDEKLGGEFPQLCRQYEPEYQQMNAAIVAYKAAETKLLAQVERHYEAEELEADQVIHELFGKATKVAVTPAVVERAKLRVDKGNPPGKKGSLGDAINWECLLASMTRNCDLYVIAEDKDWRSARGEDEFEAFLKWEWKAANGGSVRYFRRLSGFLKAMFPAINLKDEMEKEAAIKTLSGCHSFAASHAALDGMAKFSSFTGDQANTILKAVTTNRQIFGIAEDSDINDNVRRIIDNHTFGLDAEHYELYKKYYLEVEVRGRKGYK